MILRFVNTSILGLVILLTVTGLYGLVWIFPGWMYELHRFSGWALIALVPWKLLISARSLGRGFHFNFLRGLIPVISLALSGATLLVVALGLMWAWRVGPDALWFGYSTISLHWILAMVIVSPFVLHAWARWPRPRKSDYLSRRGFMQVAGLSLAGLGGWILSKSIAAWRADPTATRAATGSRLAGYLTGNTFPVTNSAGDGHAAIVIDSWNLKLSGGQGEQIFLSYADLGALPQESLTATIDCTVGWYSVQRWRGVPLSVLLKLAGREDNEFLVRFSSLEGYSHMLPMAEALHVLLATHVGGEPLSHVHGFPLRAVVPSRRGWFWVKWLSEIEVMKSRS